MFAALGHVNDTSAWIGNARAAPLGHVNVTTPLLGLAMHKQP